jgi:hypothetical protein
VVPDLEGLMLRGVVEWLLRWILRGIVVAFSFSLGSVLLPLT